ncbi:MAG: hypothetical protein ABSH12_00670 [Endomicrobiales bacterium]
MVSKWVSICLITVNVVILGIAIPCIVHADADVEESTEDPVFKRIPGYHIIEYENNDDAVDYNAAADKKAIISGHRTYYNYEINEGGTVSDEREIMQFYAKIVHRLGGEALFMGETSAGFNTATFKIPHKASETWIIVTPFDEGAGYFLYVIEHSLVNARDPVMPQPATAKLN